MIKVLVFFPMKIASQAAPEGLAGHGLSTTVVKPVAINVLDWSCVFSCCQFLSVESSECCYGIKQYELWLTI